MAREKASVSVLDRGFLLGDGIYEVIPVYHGKLFRLEEHLRRLHNSLSAIDVVDPHSSEQWRQLLESLVERNSGGDLSLYLQVTRGVAERDHAYPDKVQPTIFAMVNSVAKPPADLYQKGVAAKVMEDDRWLHCNIKTISLLPNVLLRNRALKEGCAEAILVRDGMVTEGAASNVFVVIAGRVYTAPPGPQLLTGITRDLVIELLQQADIPCIERAVSREQLFDADEVWLTSSAKEVVPVTSLDGRPVGNGQPGALWMQVIKIYRNYKEGLARF